jgi:shikimate kinase
VQAVLQTGTRHLVVATGGGTFADPQNRAAINGDGASVWLDVPLERLIARMPADGRRPLAADRAGFEHLYHQRRAAYEQAHVRLDAGRAGVEALVEQLLDWLEHYGCKGAAVLRCHGAVTASFVHGTLAPGTLNDALPRSH